MKPARVVMFEGLERRSLMTAVLGSDFDPIVGPVGTTPGTIGTSLDGAEPTGGPSNYYSRFTFNGVRYAHRPSLNLGQGTFSRDPIAQGSQSWDSALFFRMRYPLPFSGGGSMKYKSGTLAITGTNGPDVILIDPVADRLGNQVAIDITMNGDTRRINSPYVRFVGLITVDAGKGDDLVAEDANMAIRMFARGGKGNDSIAGGLGNDTLYGDDGNDVLVGGGGNDVISGDAGNNVLAGEAGADRLIKSAKDKIVQKDTRDIIASVKR